MPRIVHNMQCSNIHLIGSNFTAKMRNYFIGLTCVINAVTLFSVIAQLSIEHGSLAMNIEKTTKDGYEDLEIEGSLFVDGQINVMDENDNVFSSPYFRNRRREIGVTDGGRLDMACQLQDGSHWSKCKWKHGIRSLSIMRANSEEARFVEIFGHIMYLNILLIICKNAMILDFEYHFSPHLFEIEIRCQTMDTLQVDQ